jgi:hypothetical protein
MPNFPKRCRPVDWSCRFYGVLIRAYSPTFRAVYGGEMVQVFGDCCLAAHRRDGSWGLAAVWVSALLDLLRNAPAERTQELIRDRDARRVFLALTPVALVLAGWVCWVDAHNGELISPLLLLLFTTLLAFAQPRTAGLWGVFIGACIPLTHAMARWQGWQLPYPTDAWTPVFALLALVPALGGAAVGAVLRRLILCVRANLRSVAVVLVLSALAGMAAFCGLQALNRQPAAPMARLRHDPWQSFIRNMDPTFFLFHKANLRSDEWDHMGVQLMRARPEPSDRVFIKSEPKEPAFRPTQEVPPNRVDVHPSRAPRVAQ